MIKNKDVGMHAKEFMGITNATSMEKNCEVPGAVTSRSLENLEVLRRCNSFPLYISSNVYCDWRKKSTSTVQNRFISSNSYRQSVNSTDTPTFNYELYNLQSETKSLQELQIEVDALLEFRDLVIETFPDLKNKIISMSSAAISANTNKLHSTPRVQTKKKKLRKDSHSSFSVQGSSVLNTSVIIGEASPAFVSRSRSNSNSCKKEPKSGEGSGSVVQDSGFSTETTSSKDGHSASSTTGVLQGTNLPARNLYETDDELLNLLDVIYRKTSRFRQKFSSMQNYERDKQEAYISSASISNILHCSSFNRKVLRYTSDNPPKENVLVLRKERDKLLDRVAELESEMLEGQIKISDMEKQVQLLTSGNSNLEEQLKIALSQNQELNSKLLRSRSDSPSPICLQSSSSVTASRNMTRSVICKNYAGADQNESFTPRMSSMKDIENQSQQKIALSTCSEPTVSGYLINTESTETKEGISTSRSQKYNSDFNIKCTKDEIKSLGKLDGILNSPKYLCKVRETDSKKFAAILLETNTLELQRHLLMLTVQNQVLMQKLDELLKSKQPFGKRFNGSREEMGSYKQQVRKPSMEIVETKFKSSKSRSPQNISLHRTETMSNSKIFCNNCISPASSCTENNIKSEKCDSQQGESCTDCVRNQEIDNQTSNEYEETFQPPKRSKPSKIPLPGSKTQYSSKTLGYMSNGSSPPFTAIHKSLSYSTGNIFFKHNASKLNRQDSLIMKNRGSSASISTDTKIISPRNVFITSPLPKIKRDSVTARVRQLDYLATSRNSGKISDRTQSDNKTGSSQQLIAQNKLNKIIVSTVVNNSPITSPSRGVKGKKENSISVATKRNIMLRKDSDKSTAAKKLGHTNPSGVQALIGGNNNTNNNSSITNSSVNSSLAIDEQYNDIDIGRVRNFRSALLGWLKI